MDVAPPAKAADTANGFRTDGPLMRYLRWPEAPPLRGHIVEMLTEFDDDGYVHREFGLDDAGRVVHRVPSDAFPDGYFPYYDDRFIVDQEVANGSAEEIDQAAFERAWAQPDFPPPRSPGLVTRLLGRLRRDRPDRGGK